MLPQTKSLIQPKFSEATFRRTVWYAETEHGLTLEEICKPEYWANVAGQLAKGNRIEIYPEDGGFYAELMVVFVPEKTPTRPVNWAKVVPIAYVDLTKDEKATPVPALPAGFEAKWLGPVAKWGVRRVSDNAVIVEKQGSKNDATLEFFKKKNQLAA